MELERVITRDGSATLRVVGWDETYHSRHGAVRESEHVYLKNGILKALEIFTDRSPIRILEMGFGTGLNVLLAIGASLDFKGIKIEYHSIDSYPIDVDTAKSLDYPSHLGRPQLESLFEKVHDAPWNYPQIIHDDFILHKVETSIRDYIPEARFDLFLYDAFGPRVQPELWNVDCFRKVKPWLRDGAFMVTYCAKGEVKRAMQSAGFKVEALPGPPGKREMTRAWS
ncbi:MAG: tRNA (5-methylaminomethyl-2-thiouridine)(34)-methyltransferase MnmD [Bacteroidota bacterium]